MAARFPDAVVIGSDQVADLDGQPLGKPGNHERAVAQLRQMRGQTVVFQTAVAVVCLESGFAQMDLAPVKVQFRDSSDAEIEPICAPRSPMTAPAAPKAKAWASPCWKHRQRRPDRPGRPAADPHLPMMRAAGMHCWCTARDRRRAAAASKARLYLVPAPLDFGCDTGPAADVMPAGHAAVAAG